MGPRHRRGQLRMPLMVKIFGRADEERLDTLRWPRTKVTKENFSGMSRSVLKLRSGRCHGYDTSSCCLVKHLFV